MRKTRGAGLTLLLLGPVLLFAWASIATIAEGRARNEIIDGMHVHMVEARPFRWYELAVPATVSAVGAVLLLAGSVRRGDR